MSIDLNILNNDNLKPRDEVRLERIDAAPYPDRQRVKVTIAITPFRERPNLEVALVDAEGRRVASSSVIAVMSFTLTLTLHLRGQNDDPAGEYKAQAALYYDDSAAPQDQREVAFTIPGQSG